MVRNIKAVRGRVALAVAVPSVLLAAACGSSSESSSSAAAAATAGLTAQANVVSEVPSSVKGSPVQIAVDATYAPNEFIDPSSGEIKGWDIDLGNALCKVMGLVCTFNNVTFDDIIAQLKASTPSEVAGGDKPRYQFSMSSWSPTAKREASGIDFISYYQTGEGWVAKAGGTKVNSVGQFCGHKVAVEAGTTEESDAWGYMGMNVGGGAISGDTDHCSGGDMTVDSYATQTQADQALESGRDDFGYLDTPVATYEQKVSNGKLDGGPLLANGQPCAVAPYGIAVVQGGPLEMALQDAVKYLISSGYYHKILASWNVTAGEIPSSQVTLNNNNTVGGACVPSY